MIPSCLPIPTARPEVREIKEYFLFTACLVLSNVPVKILSGFNSTKKNRREKQDKNLEGKQTKLPLNDLFMKHEKRGEERERETCLAIDLLIRLTFFVSSLNSWGGWRRHLQGFSPSLLEMIETSNTSKKLKEDIERSESYRFPSCPIYTEQVEQ